VFKILLPVNGDIERALEAAQVITELPISDITVTVLNVQPEVSVATGDSGIVDSKEWYDESDFPPSVAAVKEEIEQADVTVELMREHAEPAEAIIDVTSEIDADRIVMAGRKRTPSGKVLFGSTTQSVLLTAAVPVTVVTAD
jgi:nucleotide-binding universal stress UspA family protein